MSRIKLTVILYFIILQFCDPVASACPRIETFHSSECIFPFQYDGTIQSKCIPIEGRYMFCGTDDLYYVHGCKAPIVNQQDELTGEYCSGTCEKQWAWGWWRWLCELNNKNRRCKSLSEQDLCYQKEECVMSCADMDDGSYRSCKSCDTFVRCEDHTLSEYTCNSNTYFNYDDDDRKCTADDDEMFCNLTGQIQKTRVLCKKYLSDLQPMCKKAADVVYQSVLEIVPWSLSEYIHYCNPKSGRESDILELQNIKAIRQRSDLVFRHYVFNYDTIYGSESDIYIPWEILDSSSHPVSSTTPKVYLMMYRCIPGHTTKVISMQEIATKQTSTTLYIEGRMGTIQSWKLGQLVPFPHDDMDAEHHYKCRITLSASGTFFIGGPGTQITADFHSKLSFIHSSGNSFTNFEGGVLNNLERKNVTTTGSPGYFILEFIGSDLEFFLPLGVDEGSEGEITVQCGGSTVTSTHLQTTTNSTSTPETTTMPTTATTTTEAASTLLSESLSTSLVRSTSDPDSTITSDMISLSSTLADNKPHKGNADGAETAEQTASSGTTIGAVVGSVIAVICAVIIIVVVCLVRRKGFPGTGKKDGEKDPTTCANPVYNCDGPIQSSSPGATAMDEDADLQTKPNKTGIYQDPKSDIVPNGQAAEDPPTIFVNNDIYNDDTIAAPEGGGGMVENDVYNDDTIAEPGVIDYINQGEGHIHSDNSVSGATASGGDTLYVELQKQPNSDNEYTHINVSEMLGEIPRTEFEENDVYENAISTNNQDGTPEKRNSRQSHVEMEDNELYG